VFAEHCALALFEESMVELDSSLLASDEEEAVDLAKRYYEDYFTAFGCINYAHGLIDGIKKRKRV